MKRSILGFVLALISMMVMSSCQKGDDYQLMTGKWMNIAESVLHGPSGEAPVSEGALSLNFTADSVLVSDNRFETLAIQTAVLSGYRLYKEDGKLMLTIDRPIYQTFEVEKLTRNKMVLVQQFSDVCLPHKDASLNPECYYRLVMKREE